MVYKKYAYRNGKRYGPYLYENIRRGNRVITKYLGMSPKPDYKKYFAYGILGILIFSLIFFGVDFVGEKNLFSFLSPPHEYSGIVLGSLREGEILHGEVEIKLRSGELLPSESEMILSYDGEERREILSDIVDLVRKDGVFYLEGVEINGLGEGYGTEGINYPEISFELEILTEDVDDSVSEEGEDIEEEDVVGDGGEEIIDEDVIEEEILEEEETQTDDNVEIETGEDGDSDDEEVEENEGEETQSDGSEEKVIGEPDQDRSFDRPSVVNRGSGDKIGESGDNGGDVVEEVVSEVEEETEDEDPVLSPIVGAGVS